MILLIKSLLVNIAILFSLTFNANLFFPFQTKQTISLKQKATFGFIAALGAILCMFYPIKTLGETHFDLRMVAILIITLYIGWFSGLIVLLCSSIFRYVLGGDYAIIGIAVSCLAYLTAIGFRKLFLQQNNKLLWGSAILFCYFLFYISLIYAGVGFLSLQFYLIYFSLFYFTFIALVLIIERLIKTNKQFEEMVYLDKLNMVGQMAASIAHEIRNPLTTVRGFIQYLGNDSKDKKLKEFTPLILEELDRTNKIITDYLNIAKPEQVELALINLGQLIDDCVDLLRPLASYSNTTIMFKRKDLYFVRGDEHHLKQAVMNVIKNGIEAIEDHGEININLITDSSQKKVQLRISDNGKGMSREELQKIGLPFYTTKTKGTGLGSMVTNKIIREMHGMIEYDSDIDKGTTVTIYLPLTRIN